MNFRCRDINSQHLIFIFYLRVLVYFYSYRYCYICFLKLLLAYFYLNNKFKNIIEQQNLLSEEEKCLFPYEQIEFPVIKKLDTRSKRAFVWYRWSRIVLAMIVCVVTRATFVYLFGTKQTRTFIRSIGKQSIIHAHTCV